MNTILIFFGINKILIEFFYNIYEGKIFQKIMLYRKN